MKCKVLVMSVGDYETNWTVKYIEKIGGEKNLVVVLPKSSEDKADSYTNRGLEVYIYDHNKYINDDFEYFGFNRRNCGGVGRQGIAEAVENLDDGDTIFFELDDDTAQLCCRKRMLPGIYRGTSIKVWEDLEKIIKLEYKFYLETGCIPASMTGASMPNETGFIAQRKIFNNFLMIPKNPLNFIGFRALCSDDYRFNVYNNIIGTTPMFSHNFGSITFHQNQGDRTDGNAPLYNSDCSWKKSYSLKMMFPAYTKQRIVKETNRVLFRENILPSKMYPPILLTDEDGKVIGKAG